MVGFGEAIAYGAATVVNAIATGKGSALGVDLWTKARVWLTDEAGVITGKIISDSGENITLIKESIQTTLRYFKANNEFGAIVETESNIPIARGMKSSSAASNALVLATAGAMGKDLDDLVAINLGVEASIRAKTTITSAFDDASASFLGNIVLTDNFKRKILNKFKVKEELVILFHVPSKKSYTFTSNVKRMRLIAPQVEVAFREALSGNYWEALTLNGLLYSSVLGYDPKLAIDALEAGAVASGLSGTGPATVAVLAQDNVNSVVSAWRPYKGKIIKAGISRKKAYIMRKE